MQSEGNDTKRPGKWMIWRQACQQSQSWCARQQIIDEAWSEDLNQDPVQDGLYRQDLLPGLQNLIIVDTFDQNEKTCQTEPFGTFCVRVRVRAGSRELIGVLSLNCDEHICTCNALK